jgi:hypothetical protein
MTKQGKYQRTLDEKYEIYLNSMRSVIITNIQSSPHIITKFKQYIITRTWVGQLQFIVIHLVHYHTIAITTGLHITLI